MVQPPSAHPEAHRQIAEDSEDKNTSHQAYNGSRRLFVLVVKGFDLGGGKRQRSGTTRGIAVRSGWIVTHRVDLPFDFWDQATATSPVTNDVPNHHIADPSGPGQVAGPFSRDRWPPCVLDGTEMAQHIQGTDDANQNPVLVHDKEPMDIQR